MKGIVKYLVENPSPSDEEIHQWAEDNGYEPEEVEEFIYELLSSILRKMSKSADKPDSDFDPDELKRGIEVEKEHTDNDFIAKMIAKDHLSEKGMSDYYTRLDEMEKQGKTEKKNVKAHVLARLLSL